MRRFARSPGGPARLLRTRGLVPALTARSSGRTAAAACVQRFPRAPRNVPLAPRRLAACSGTVARAFPLGRFHLTGKRAKGCPSGGSGMLNDRRILWVLLIVVLLVVLWFALDHVLFPTLPVPAGAAPITHG